MLKPIPKSLYLVSTIELDGNAKEQKSTIKTPNTNYIHWFCEWIQSICRWFLYNHWSRWSTNDCAKKDQEKVLKIPVKESVEGLTPSIDPISKKDVTAKEKRFEVTPIQPLQQNAIPTTIDKGLIQPAEHTNKNQDITPAKNQVIKTLELPNTSIKSDKPIAESAEKLKGNTVPVVTKKCRVRYKTVIINRSQISMVLNTLIMNIWKIRSLI